MGDIKTAPQSQFFAILDGLVAKTVVPELLRLADAGKIPSDIFNKDTLQAARDTLASEDKREIILRFIAQAPCWANILPCMFTGAMRESNMTWVKDNCHILISGIPKEIASEVEKYAKPLTIGKDIREKVVNIMILSAKGFIKRSLEFIIQNGEKLGELETYAPMGYCHYCKYTSAPYRIGEHVVDVGYWSKAVDL